MINQILPSDLTENQKAVLLSLSSMNEKGKWNNAYFHNYIFFLAKSLPDVFEYMIYTFDATNHGPESEYVDELIDKLKDYALIDNKKNLTSNGKQLATMLGTDPESLPIIQKIKELDTAFEGLSVKDLFYMVHTLFPEYTTNPDFVTASEKLETFKFNVNDVQDGRIDVVVSDKGNAVQIKRIDNEFIIGYEKVEK